MNELAWGVGPSIRQSRVGAEFFLEMILLNLWIKLTQIGYFRATKIKTAYEFYIFILI